MYVYFKTSDYPRWEVGFYRPDGEFILESTHDSPEAAAQRTAWLNGSSYRLPTITNE